MILGLLPEIRGGLGALAETGQHSRFIDGYLRPYAEVFDDVRYFSYREESLRDFTGDAALAARVWCPAAAAIRGWPRGSCPCAGAGPSPAARCCASTSSRAWRRRWLRAGSSARRS